MSAKDMKTVFVAALRAIDGVASAVDHEPERLDVMPCVTMLLVSASAVDVETGGAQDVTYRWRVSLYVNLASGYGAAQDVIEVLLPKVLRTVRTDYNLGGTCDWAKLTDEGEDPVFAHGEGWVRKSVYLEALTDEA